jgi:hypothetical protein
LSSLINSQHIDAISRQQIASTFNSIVFFEIGTRALKLAVECYLSQTHRHCVYIDHLGKKMETRTKKLFIVAKEADRLVDELKGSKVSHHFVSNLMSILDIIKFEPPVNVQPGGKKLKHKPGSIPHILDKLWMMIIRGQGGGFNRQTMSPYNAKRILNRLPNRIIPVLKSPLMIVDFLTRQFDSGGIFSLLSLGSIFTLMTKHHL